MTRINEILHRLEVASKSPIPSVFTCKDAICEILRLRNALERIEGFADSEAAEPMDDVIEIATRTLRAEHT
jgi:hypothetical protein